MYSSACTIATANTNRDGTGTLALLAAPASGARIDCVKMRAMGTPGSGGYIRFFLKTPAGTFHLIHEVTVGATQWWSSDWFPQSAPVALPSNLRIGAGCELHVSTQNADTFHVSVFGSTTG